MKDYFLYLTFLFVSSILIGQNANHQKGEAWKEAITKIVVEKIVTENYKHFLGVKQE